MAVVLYIHILFDECYSGDRGTSKRFVDDEREGSNDVTSVALMVDSELRRFVARALNVHRALYLYTKNHSSPWRIS